LRLVAASRPHRCTMVHVTRRMMMAAVVAQLMRQRQRARERAFEIRKLQLSWLATQSFPLLLAMANSGAGQARRIVPRALGKWRGSTLSGYLSHDDQTYLERFRATRGIGVFFDTRKGSFRYKISLHIITYHVAIIVYHFVSLSISQYIMSIGDT
jgi:hypothetical protein